MTVSYAVFQKIYAGVRNTDQWKTMASTVEDSPWHREENVAVHTAMCIEHYLVNTAAQRTDRQQMLTLMTLLFHDFGKPEAEETLDKKDGTGQYRRYAGHESVSANEFISFMCEHRNVVQPFFDAGFTWKDIRKIKFMIEQHLPFGLKNKTKRQFLRDTVAGTLGEDETCFYDQLWSDCNGRISDDHETKKQSVTDWIAEFKAIPAKPPRVVSPIAPNMYVLVGVVGVGKTTWTKNLKSLNPKAGIVVVCEDDYRVQFAEANFTTDEFIMYENASKKARYAMAWQFCFDSKGEYDKFAKAQLKAAVETGSTIVVDRTNQSRKARGPSITAGKTAGYEIHAVEFYLSESEMHARQKTRCDKDVPHHRAHAIFMNMETPWFPVEVDSFEIVPPT